MSVMKKESDLSYKVIDKGFLRLVDFMGGDVAVVQAARVSLGQESKGPKRDKLLIDYLLGHKHETPFEHSVFKFHVKCPLFVARQWFRHRLASYNEISGRYTEMEFEFCLPDRLRTQKALDYKYEDLEKNKNLQLKEQIQIHFKKSYELYQQLLEEGVAKEHARIVLPLALYTQFYWTVNARALMNFLSLRLDTHAQYEIRQYAEAIFKIFEQKMPWSYAAFRKYYF
jgi:thymidylate synthase (FAD)